MPVPIDRIDDAQNAWGITFESCLGQFKNNRPVHHPQNVKNITVGYRRARTGGHLIQ